jgi:hypothetical protein
LTCLCIEWYQWNRRHNSLPLWNPEAESGLITRRCEASGFFLFKESGCLEIQFFLELETYSHLQSFFNRLSPELRISDQIYRANSLRIYKTPPFFRHCFPLLNPTNCPNPFAKTVLASELSRSPGCIETEPHRDSQPGVSYTVITPVFGLFPSALASEQRCYFPAPMPD